ncbi:DNA polymerase Y family protein [Sneathiella marina]|uniref:DNA polymerase Y family protein n=1 Tax=Sneathiella marina TaxID=2950108 RepID=A0ABY4W041_9PROT|nr:DNA polymerase Y family protein [Sneathiella marina]USG60453.1 DNA polymerase Y family protein [Sneathiella marina]
MRRFLSVWLPHWSMERYLQKNMTIGQEQHKALRQKTPFALVASGSRGQHITSINMAAEDAGITVGLPLADARALCPALATAETMPDADAAALEQLALWCLRYSPMVTTHKPDGFALDISGCAHLFGGEQAMLEAMAEKIRQFHLTPRLAIADTIGTAWAAARFGKTTITVVEEGETRAFLAPLPLTALRLEDRTVKRLKQLGLRHINALLDAPQAPLTTRFGPQLIKRLHQATGAVPEIFGPLVPPPSYHVRYPFIEPVIQLEAVEVVLGILAERMMRQLKQMRKGARQLELRLFRVDGHLERLSVGTSRLCADADHITLLFQENLSRLRDDLDMGFGFDLMTMSAFDVENVTHIQQAWGSRKGGMISSQGLGQLLDRFGNRFGFDKVTRFIPAESYIPERAFRKIPAHSGTQDTSWQGTNQRTVSRPFLLFTAPEPVMVLAEVPDGPPLRFKWRRRQHRIIAADGPERLSPEWWRTSLQDTSLQTRDYYRVEDSAGYRFWLFRDGLYDREEDHPLWYLHGLFP